MGSWDNLKISRTTYAKMIAQTWDAHMKLMEHFGWTNKENKENEVNLSLLQRPKKIKAGTKEDQGWY